MDVAAPALHHGHRPRGWGGPIVLAAIAVVVSPAVARDDAPHACCLGDGTCVEVPLPLCVAIGGIAQPEESCDGMDCPLFGACCMPDLACAPLAEIDCAAEGGIYQGDGAHCAEVECPLIGACCLPDGSCALADVAGCMAEGGVYEGTFTSCAGRSCLGACGLPDGSCLARLAPAECALRGGSALGPGTTCRGVTGPVLAHLGSFAFLQNDVVTLDVPRFDDEDGARELTRVRIEIDAIAFAFISLVNLGTYPIDTTVSFSESVSAAMPILPNRPVVDASGTLACEEMLPPMEECTYGSPVIFPGEAEFEFDGPLELPFFVGKGTFTIIVTGSGTIGPPQNRLVSFSVFPHRAEGLVRVLYEYETTGACCFGSESCQVVTTSQCASIGGVFVGGTCTGFPCAPPAAPPAPSPPARSRRGAAAPHM
jgi:hypothetical protein